MNIFDILIKYKARILIFAIILSGVIFSVYTYNKNYEKTAESLKNISTIENTKVKIKSYPSADEDTVTFTGEIIDSPENRLLGIKMNVIIEGLGNGDLYPDDILIMDGVIFHTQKPRNIGGFNDIEYGKSLGTYGTLYCGRDSFAALHTESNNGLMIKMCILRAKFIHNADRLLPPRYSGIAKALVTGDRSCIYSKDKLNFQKSGVYHIVAISGLHLNIFIMAFSYFISNLKLKRFKKALLSAIICGSAGCFVLVFTGFGTSVIRAFAMLIISLASAIFGRKYNPKNSLFTASAIILVFMPSAFYSVGFSLSVLSTLGVLISADTVKYLKRSKRLSAFASYTSFGTAITSFVCIFVTLPVTADAFGYLSVYSFLANILILPLMTPALGGCVILGVTSILGFGKISGYIAYPLSVILRLITYFADFTANLPLSTVNLYPKYTLYILVFIIVLSLGLFCFYRKKKILAASILLIFTVAVGCNFVYNKDNDEAKVIFPYSGQGDAAIVTVPGDRAFMVDFGSSSYTEYTEDEIIKSLIKYNIRELDAVFVSHFHIDHMSGIVRLTKDGYVNNLLLPKHFDKDDDESMENLNKLLEASIKSQTPVYYLEDESLLKYGDDISFEVLSPRDDMDLDANEMSMVINFTYGDTSFLFTGDISDKTTKYLYEKNIDCDVLKIPHHGSKTSNDGDFIKIASPEYAVICCGENNIYEHPHRDVTDTLKALDIETFRTDKSGTVTFYMDKKGIKSIKTMR